MLDEAPSWPEGPSEDEHLNQGWKFEKQPATPEGLGERTFWAVRRPGTSAEERDGAAVRGLCG